MNSSLCALTNNAFEHEQLVNILSKMFCRFVSVLLQVKILDECETPHRNKNSHFPYLTMMGRDSRNALVTSSNVFVRYD